MRCIMEVNAAFMASYRFATRWEEGASAHDYDEGHYGANEGLPETIPMKQTWHGHSPFSIEAGEAKILDRSVSVR